MTQLLPQEPKGCGKKELHRLFIELATLIEAHDDDDGDDFIDMDVEPVIEAFVARHYSDVDPQRIVIYLMVWFTQWRMSRGLWQRAGDLKDQLAS
jgi:hypothetical protein